MSFIMGSCDGDGVAQRELSIQQTFTVDRSEACDSYSRNHRWRGCMYRFGERLYCILPGEPEIVNVYPNALCV